MALTAGTDTFVTVAEADTYFTNMNNSAWSALDDAAKEAALREATQYLDTAYNWRGIIQSTSQALSWPRSYVYDHEGRTVTGIPQRIKDATCELALASIDDRLAPTQDNGAAIKRQKVGQLEVEYQDGAVVKRSYPYISRLVKGLHRGSNGINAAVRRV